MSIVEIHTFCPHRYEDKIIEGVIYTNTRVSILFFGYLNPTSCIYMSNPEFRSGMEKSDVVHLHSDPEFRYLHKAQHSVRGLSYTHIYDTFSYLGPHRYEDKNIHNTSISGIS